MVPIRNSFLAGMTTVTLIFTLLGWAGLVVTEQVDTPWAPNALQDRTVGDLRAFNEWLNENQARGYIGEVGWPSQRFADATRWNALAEAWYQEADAGGLWVSAWSTGEWWRTTYPLSVYEERTIGEGVRWPNSQAPVVEAHPSTGRYVRGINVAGGAFGAPDIAPVSPFSNKNPGRIEETYHYDGQATFDYLASRGHGIVRIGFRWERLQPELGGPLDPAELDRLKAVVQRADRAGMKVVLDVHNYGAYYLESGGRGKRRAVGTEHVPIERFTDLWRRLATEFRGNTGIAAYGLMNEPIALPAVFTSTVPLQNWDRPNTGWTIVGDPSMEEATTGGRTGGALRVNVPSLRDSSFTIRGSIPAGQIQDPTTRGDSLAVWVYLAETASGEGIRASLSIPGDVPGDGVLLIPGEWTLVTARFVPRALGATRSINIDIGATTAPEPFVVLVDDLAQGTAVAPAQVWEAATRSALSAIRATGDRTLVMVPGYYWSQVHNWSRHHPLGWIVDPANNFRYEAHSFWDSDFSSRYPNSFAIENRRAALPWR